MNNTQKQLGQNELAKKAFNLLYPEKDLSLYHFSVKYSGKFSSYNANVRYSNSNYTFNLSSEWKDISPEIQIGLIQHLLQKIFKTKISTINQELYDSFMKNIHIAVPKENVDPILKKSFNRVNEKYFLGTVEMPNLVFGENSFNKLGSYQYGTDTIKISRVFKNISDEEILLLDYVMYHEILHKVHKFKTKNGRSIHHSKKFRYAEKQFEGYPGKDMEEELTKFLRKKRFKSYFGFD